MAVFEKLEPTRFVIPWSSTAVGKVDFSGGYELWIDASMFPIVDGEGRLKNVVCQWLDVTRIKHAEQELQHYSKHLENMVAERTQELQDAQEKILRQERLAVLGELAGSVGHELRNPPVRDHQCRIFFERKHYRIWMSKPAIIFR